MGIDSPPVPWPIAGQRLRATRKHRRRMRLTINKLDHRAIDFCDHAHSHYLPLRALLRSIRARSSASSLQSATRFPIQYSAFATC
jgi:hypothetical protein